MHLKTLVDKFDGWINLPVTIDHVRQAILDLGVQEKIVYSPQDLDPEVLRGAFYKYTARNTLYGDPERVSLIVYSTREQYYWQRVICCKESVHIFDSPAASTKTPEEVIGLAEQLMGPLSTDSHGLSDFQAVTDRLALYQCLCILFPDDARDIALKAIADGLKDEKEVAAWAELPLPLVKLVLSDGWPGIKDTVLDC